MNSILAEIGAFDAGRVAGQMFVSVLLLAGILKCVSISRRATTNSRCVWALALLLTGWLLPALVSLFSFSSQTTPYRVAIGLAGLCAMALIVASVIFAVIGLVEYARERGRFSQGRAQAIWALILCGLFAVLCVIGIVTASPAAARLKNQPVRGQILSFEDLNFKFTAPGRPWVQADANKINPYAKIAFIRARPEMYFMVIAEQSGNLDCTSESLAEIGRSRLQSISDSSQVMEQTPHMIAGLEGLEVHTEGKTRGYPIHYVQWFCATNGWAYQLMVWGKQTDRQEITDESQRLMSGFALLDYQRRPAMSGTQTIEDYVSTNFAYRVSCANSDLIQWRNLDTDAPSASFGAVHRQNVALCVTAISLDDLPVDPEAIYRGLSGLLTREDALKNARRIQEHQMDGVDAAFSQAMSNGKEYSYRLKILHGGGFAWMAATWTESGTPKKEQIMADVLSRVEFLDTPRPPPETQALSEREKRAQRMALNGIGMIYFNGQRFDQSARFFQRAVALDDTRTNAFYLPNLTEALIRSGHLRKALDVLEEQPDVVDTHPALAANRAFLQGRLGELDLAVTNYANLFAAGYKSADHFREYLSLLVQNQQSKKALAEVEDYLEKEDSPELRLAQASLLKQMKRYDDAIALMQAQRKKNPFHNGIALSLGDAMILSGKPNEAMGISDEMAKDSGPGAASWTLKGRAQFALKWYREARQSFEEVLKEAPADVDARQFLQIIAGVLGEGSTAGIREPISPVPVPAELTNTLPNPAADFGRDEGAYYSRQLTAVSFRKGGELKTTERWSARILSATGVAAFSSFQIAFNPLNEDVFVNDLVVKSADGGIVSTGRVSDYYVLDDHAGAAAGNRKLLNIPVPGLQSGYQIELTLTRQEFGHPEEFTFRPFMLAGTMPVQERALYFSGDTNLIQFASSPKSEPRVIAGGLCWCLTEPVPVRWEPLLPATMDYVPMVWLNGRNSRWSDLVTNYLATIRDRFELPAEQERVAKQIASQTTNLQERIATIGNYVQTNFTYKAIEFGRRARVPQTPGEFVRNRYGDCKDHSLLAQQMLKAAGIPASLGLLNSSAAIREDLPSLDQFDHMIVFVPTGRGNVFLDCTAKSLDLAMPASGLAGRKVLVLDSARPRFEMAPMITSNASSIFVTRTIEVTNRHDGLVRETLKFSGAYAGWYREYFRNVPSANRRTIAASIFAGAGELNGLEITGLEQANVPLMIELNYVCRGLYQPMTGGCIVTSPLNIERTLLSDQQVEKRTAPFEIQVPFSIEGSVTIRVPRPMAANPVSSSVQDIHNEFLSGHCTTTARGADWCVEYRLLESAGRFPASQYQRHVNAMRQALDALSAKLMCSGVAQSKPSPGAPRD